MLSRLSAPVIAIGGRRGESSAAWVAPPCARNMTDEASGSPEAERPGVVDHRARVATGESVIKCPFPLNVLKDTLETYDHRCYLARSDEYQHFMTDSPSARPGATPRSRPATTRPRSPPTHRRWPPTKATTSSSRTAAARVDEGGHLLRMHMSRLPSKMSSIGIPYVTQTQRGEA